MASKSKQPKPDVGPGARSLTETEKRLADVRQMYAAAEKMGSTGSARVLKGVVYDLERLVRLDEDLHVLSTAKGKFNPETCKKILATLRRGLWLSHAADLAGVDRTNVHLWVKLGKQNPEGKYGQFARDVAAVRSEQTGAMLDRALEFAKAGDGNLLMRILERRDPEHFAPIQRVQIDLEGAKERMLEIAANVLPHEYLEKLLDALGSDGESPEDQAPIA